MYGFFICGVGVLKFMGGFGRVSIGGRGIIVGLRCFLIGVVRGSLARSGGIFVCFRESL